MMLDMATIARFEAKVDRSGGADACHLWLAAADRDGYGQFSVYRKQKKAHRVAIWISTGEEPPSDRVVDHLCKNTSCVNRRHLELVVAEENVRRGDSPATLGARRKLCSSGHEFDATRANGRHRKCSTCQKRYSQEHRERRQRADGAQRSTRSAAAA